jgi:predicted restriction endonuclease
LETQYDNGFDPLTLHDDRRRTLTSIVMRQGQPGFRSQLLTAYEGRCAITNCDALDMLEAAHIMPYSGLTSSVVSNGLLLRADIHTLFDRGLVFIDTADMSVQLAPSLRATVYAELVGKRIRLPRDRAAWPSAKALGQHRAWSEGRLE